MRARWLCPLLGILLIPTLQAAEEFWDEIPLSPSTTAPTQVLDDYWNGEFLRVNREVAAAQDTRLVFFGDSLTWFWSLGKATGRDVWEHQFAAYHPINMGNSGDITPVMLYRLTHGNLAFPAGREPAVAVVLCGINNFGVTQSAGGKEKWDLGIHCPPEDIAQGQRAVAQLFRRRLPRTRVILMALLPVADPVKWERCRQVNALNARLAFNSNEVAFVNLQASFLQPDGTLNRALYADGLHLTPQGYHAWAKGIAPVLEKFMQAPPLAPTKIMLIGGSATEGLDSASSYRRYLDGLLRRSGYLIDFVGSRHKHNQDTAEPESYQFDPDHEGHWDKDSAWFAQNMAGLLNLNVPDVAVLHLGAEDIASSTTAPEPLTDGIVRNLSRVVEALRSRNPNVKILIAQPLPTTGKEAATRLLNRKLRVFASSAASKGQPVVVAETDRGFDRRQDLDSSGRLPSAAGARKIAATLAEAIKPLLEPAR